MRAPLSDPLLRANIGTRFFVAVLAAPFVAVGAAIFSLAYLVRYVLTGRRPDDFGPPRDRQAEKIRDALSGPDIMIH